MYEDNQSLFVPGAQRGKKRTKGDAGSFQTIEDRPKTLTQINQEIRRWRMVRDLHRLHKRSDAAKKAQAKIDLWTKRLRRLKNNPQRLKTTRTLHQQRRQAHLKLGLPFLEHTVEEGVVKTLWNAREKRKDHERKMELVRFREEQRRKTAAERAAKKRASKRPDTEVDHSKQLERHRAHYARWKEHLSRMNDGDATIIVGGETHKKRDYYTKARDWHADRIRALGGRIEEGWLWGGSSLKGPEDVPEKLRSEYERDRQTLASIRKEVHNRFAGKTMRGDLRRAAYLTLSIAGEVKQRQAPIKTKWAKRGFSISSMKQKKSWLRW